MEIIEEKCPIKITYVYSSGKTKRKDTIRDKGSVLEEINIWNTTAYDKMKSYRDDEQQIIHELLRALSSEGMAFFKNILRENVDTIEIEIIGDDDPKDLLP